MHLLKKLQLIAGGFTIGAGLFCLVLAVSVPTTPITSALSQQDIKGRATISGRSSLGSGVIANAGADRAVFVNETIALDGTSSVGAFDGLRTNDDDHSIQWDFGYGGWTYQGGLIAPIAYPETGTFIVTLTIYDTTGASSSDTTTITVNAITLGSEETLTDTGNVATNTTNFQAAIDGSLGTNNKVITLPAGFRSNPIVLKHRTVANYCTIRTANHVSLPNGIGRVVPADASNMAILETSTNAPILTTPTTSSTPARYYNFIGIHFRKTTSTTNYTNAFVALGIGDETSVTQLPNHFIFDRCFFDGGSTTSNTLRGIFLRGTDVSAVNSYFHRFKGVAIETQAILYFVGERIATINCFLEGATENTMSGGGDHSITGLTVNDVVFRRNHAKKDLGWRSGDPAYYGTDMSVKNVFEMKKGNRWSVQGNRFEHHWQEDQIYSIAITVRNQDGADTWAEIKYLDFAHNQIHITANGMNIAAEDDLNPALPTHHVMVRHNVFTGVNFYSGQNLMWLIGSGQGSSPFVGLDRVYIVNNSVDLNGDPLAGQGKGIEFDTSINHTNFVFSGNIVQGHFNSGVSPGFKGDAAFDAACISYSATKNGFYRSSGTNPADNTTVALIADVKYANLGIFDLSLAGDSPFLTTGLGGGRAGADVATVNTLCTNVVTGAW